VVSALRSARRHHVEDKADALLTLLRRSSLQQPSTVAAAFAAIVSSQIVLIRAFNTQIEQLQVVVAENFDQHQAAEIYLRQPGLGQVLAARVLGEFGDDPRRFGGTPARKNYSGQSPITRARSPEHRARNPSSWPASQRTTDSATRCTSKPCRR